MSQQSSAQLPPAGHQEATDSTVPRGMTAARHEAVLLLCVHNSGESTDWWAIPLAHDLLDTGSSGRFGSYYVVWHLLLRLVDVGSG